MLRLILFAFFLFSVPMAKAQDNSIKFFALALGESVYTYGVWNAGLSYERHFTAQHSIIIDATLLFNDSGGFPLDGLHKSLRYGVSLSYRYYFVSSKKFLNNCWISPGFRYQNWQYESNNQTSLKKTVNFNGMKLLVGKQTAKFGNHNWHFDFGIGFSYGKRNYSDYEYTFRDYESGEVVVKTELPASYFLFLPELQIRLGLDF